MQTVDEIRVRPVVRWIVTEYHRAGSAAHSSVIGEFDNEWQAERVVHAMRHAPPMQAEAAPPTGESKP